MPPLEKKNSVGQSSDVPQLILRLLFPSLALYQPFSDSFKMIVLSKTCFMRLITEVRAGVKGRRIYIHHFLLCNEICHSMQEIATTVNQDKMLKKTPSKTYSNLISLLVSTE